MSDVTIKHLVDIVAGWLQDTASDQNDRHWTETELVYYYNRAAVKIASIAADANVITEAIKLSSGSKHSLPTKAIKLARIVRNMGTDGRTPGAAINMSYLSVMEAYDRDWSTATATATIQNAMQDPLDPTGFYSYPPADGTSYVLAEFSAVPESVTWDEDGSWESELVGVTDRYIDPLLKEMLAYAYKKDSDFPGSKERENDMDAESLQNINQVRGRQG